MKLPIIDARSERGKIGIESTPGKFDIQQQPASLDVQTSAAKIDIHSEAPQLHVDSTRFWQALNGGTAKQLVERIASQIPALVLQNIDHIVQKGNRMAALNDGAPNPIPDIAFEEFKDRGTKLEYLGSPSFDGIDMEYEVHKPDINIVPGKAEIHATPHRPDVQFTRGGAKVYMERYPKVTIIPPVIDLSV